VAQPTRADREVLPIPDRPYDGPVYEDAKDPEAKFPPIEPMRPPAGAPNVLVVLVDDAGFGCSSAFGGPCQTPTAERLAGEGLKFNRFHTTALCSPTRGGAPVGPQPPLGRNGRDNGDRHLRARLQLDPSQHLCAAGRDAEAQRICDRAVREMPRGAGMGDEPARPVRLMAERRRRLRVLLRLHRGETNQYYPAIYEGTTPVEPEKTPEQGYHFTEDMTDKAITWIRQQKALMGEKPFFVYFAPGATHAPHHVPAEWSAKYKGKFDQGWDTLREETFARQKELGVIPSEAELTARPEEIPAWDDIPDDLKHVLSRQMEVYAGFLEHTDHHVGRLVDALEDLGVLEETLV
jgi:Sulfatase